MKKTMLSSMMVGAMALTLCGLFSAPALAECPLKAPCNCEKCTKPAPPMELKKPMTPEERAKFREEKKAEIDERLQLSAEQKKQIEQIKADERKKLAPYRIKIKKEQEKLNKLFEQERAVKMESVKKFETVLTTEQKAELAKIKEEAKEEMKKMVPPMGMCPKKHFGPKYMGPMGPEGTMMPPPDAHKPMCPPQCGCKCHPAPGANPEPANCDCPCHKAPEKSATKK